MNIYAIVLLCLSIGLTVLLTVVWLRQGKCNKEGFEANVEEEVENPLIKLIAKVNRVGNRLLDVDMWKDRIMMYKMSPTDLARHYIKSQQTSE